MSLLARCLAGETPPTSPWESVPTINFLRTRLLDSFVATSPSLELVGRAVMSLGQSYPVYNVCDGLDPTVRITLPESTRKAVLNTVPLGLKQLGDVRAYIPAALAELRVLGMPEAHCNFIRPFLTASSPLLRLAGLVVLLILAAVLLISLPLLKANQDELPDNVVVSLAGDTVVSRSGATVVI